MHILADKSVDKKFEFVIPDDPTKYPQAAFWGDVLELGHFDGHRPRFYSDLRINPDSGERALPFN